MRVEKMSSAFMDRIEVGESDLSTQCTEERFLSSFLFCDDHYDEGIVAANFLDVAARARCVLTSGEELPGRRIR
jgi:hypothetical protein